MAVHAIPDLEKEIHVENQNCQCNPELIVDYESGEMVWMHRHINLDSIFDNFVNLDSE